MKKFIEELDMLWFWCFLVIGFFTGFSITLTVLILTKGG